MNIRKRQSGYWFAWTAWIKKTNFIAKEDQYTACFRKGERRRIKRCQAGFYKINKGEILINAK